MPIKKKLRVKKSSSSAAAPLKQLKGHLSELATLKEAANSASNAVNRKKTVIKNALYEFLEKNGGGNNDGVLIDGVEVAFRPNVSEEINPRVWYEWWQTKRISDNQFFSALSVSVTTARNAIGNDQISQVTHETLSKTADLRIVPLDPNADNGDDGTIRPFAGAKVPTAKVARQQVTDNSGKAVATIRKKVVRKIRL